MTSPLHCLELTELSPHPRGRDLADLAPKITYDCIQIKWLDIVPQSPSREEICGLREAAGRLGADMMHRLLLGLELGNNYQKRTFLI
jgi:hypothetical protein